MILIADRDRLPKEPPPCRLTPHGRPGPAHRCAGQAPARRIGLRAVALGYLFALLLIPVVLIFFKAFEDGVAHAWEAVTTPEALHAF